MPAEAGEPLLIEFKTRWKNSDPATCAGLNSMIEALNALKAAVEKLQNTKAKLGRTEIIYGNLGGSRASLTVYSTGDPVAE